MGVTIEGGKHNNQKKTHLTEISKSWLLKIRFHASSMFLTFKIAIAVIFSLFPFWFYAKSDKQWYIQRKKKDQEESIIKLRLQA